jgi:hypothetical protein
MGRTDRNVRIAAPDKWPSEWPESELDGEEAVRGLKVMWDSEIGPLSLAIRAQRSERIGCSGWFGRTPTDPNERRRCAPELYAATFAWIQAEQAYRAVEASKTATRSL